MGDQLLVCDIGGGTTDLTLVAVAEEAGDLVLERMAVGNHLLVGGDNMDLALAHHAAGLFADKGVKLNPWQSVALWHSCRTAKKALLAADGPAAFPISVSGRGSRLIGKTVSVEVDRQSVADLLVEGFFPPVRSATVRRSGGCRAFGSLACPSSRIRPSAGTWRHSPGPWRGGRRAGPADPRAVQRRRVQGRGVSATGCWRSWAPGFPAAGPQMLSGAHDLDHAVARVRPTTPRQAPRRRADPRRHGPGVLRGHRNGRTGDSRGPRAR